MITANLRTVKEIPLRLAGKDHPERLEIRGECYLPFDAFEALNLERAKAGEPVFANPRNSAAGSLRQLDPAETARRPLRFFGFLVVLPEGQRLPFATQWELLEQLHAWGIPVERHRRRCDTLAEVIAFTHTVESALRAELNFGIDGVVVKINSLTAQDELGTKGSREPRWAIARKFAPDIGETQLLRIGVNVGRTGALNPYAVLAPVEIGGTTVSRATLHNEAFVRTNDLREGDVVLVKRAGDVIPKVIGPVPERRTGKEQVWEMPDHCPVCGTKVQRAQDEAAIYCPNLGCPGRQLENLVHFTSRAAMDIRGLSEARLELLVNEGIVKDVADIFTLEASQLAELERLGEKSGAALVAAIASAKARPLSRLLHGLGIRHVGAVNAQLLARHFKTMEALSKATAEEILGVHGIGETIAGSVAAYFAEESTRELLARLRRAGVAMEEPAVEAVGSSLAGQTVVITGTLPTLSRAQATALVTANGGRVTASVTKTTSFVIAGEEAGSKLEKAKELKIEVIDEAELRRRIDRQSRGRE